MTKKIFLGMALVGLLAACTDDYKDWLTPSVVNQPETVSFGDGSVSTVGVIDFNTVTDEMVKVCSITAPTASDASFTPSYTITLGGEKTFDIGADGLMKASDLQDYVVSQFGRRPVERTIEATVSMWLSNGTTAVKTATSGIFHITAIPKAPQISQNYYIVGGPNDWGESAKNKMLKFNHSGMDVYEDPIFTVIFNASEGDTWFAIGDDEACDAITNDGDWSKLFGTTSGNGENGLSGSLSRRTSLSDDGSFKVDGTAKFIRIQINMSEMTYTITPLNFAEYIYEAGVNNNWGADAQPLYCPDGNGTYTGFFYAQDADWSDGKGAFKFTGAFNSWDEGNYGTGTINDDGLSGTLIDDGGSGNVLAEPGFYKADVNLADMTYQLTPITGIGLIGPAQAGGWDTDTDLTYNPETRAFEGTIELAADQYKFRANDGWDINWGGTLENLTQDGSNLAIEKAGKYFIQFFPLCETKSYAVVTPVE